MTFDQAKAELNRLCAALQVTLPPATAEEYIVALLNIAPERGHAVIQNLIEKWDEKRFPPIAVILKKAEGIAQSGHRKPIIISVNPRLIEQQNKFESMTDEEYQKIVDKLGGGDYGN